MHRNIARVVSVLVIILIAVWVPVISSGYSELEKASTASSYVEMAERYESAARRLPWRADLHELAGHAYYHAKEYALADAAYQEALQGSRLSAEGWAAWGDVNYLNGDPQRATQIWERALEQENPSDQLYSRLAQIAQTSGNYSKAARYLARFVSHHPGDAAARYRLGLLLALTDPEGALIQLVSASQLDPKFDPAVQTLRTALNQATLSGSPSEQFIIIGRGLGLVEEWPLARAAFEEAVEQDAENGEAWAWLGEARQQAGQPGDGSAELDRALALQPESPVVRGLRGLHFQRAGNFRQALAEFQTAARLEPENPAWFVSLGESHAKLGDLIRALEAYRTATTLAPEDAQYWRLLAIFCAQNNINIKDTGVPAAWKAVALSPNDPASLDVLGWLLLLDARYEEAGRKLARALELDPGYAPAHLHLGMLDLQKDDRASAYDHLIQARDLGNSEAAMLLEQYFP